MIEAFCDGESKEFTSAEANGSFPCNKSRDYAVSVYPKFAHAASTLSHTRDSWIEIAKMPVPYKVVPNGCPVSLAPLPDITYGVKKVMLTDKTLYPVCYIARSLGARGLLQQEWVDGDHAITIPVNVEGTGLTWGNNDPIHFWSLKLAHGDPHGNPLQMYEHYSDLYPQHMYLKDNNSGRTLWLEQPSTCGSRIIQSK